MGEYMGNEVYKLFALSDGAVAWRMLEILRKNKININ